MWHNCLVSLFEKLAEKNQRWQRKYFCCYFHRNHHWFISISLNRLSHVFNLFVFFLSCFCTIDRSHIDKSPVILTVSRVQNKMQRSSSISVGTPTPTLAQRGGITAPLPVDVRLLYQYTKKKHKTNRIFRSFSHEILAKYPAWGGVYTDINIAFDAGPREKEFRKS